MRLQAALDLRRELEARGTSRRYKVMRSGVRSPNVSPFYVAVDRSKQLLPKGGSVDA